MLMVGAGLLLRTFWGLLQENPGFNPSRVVAANVYLPVPNNPDMDRYAKPEILNSFVREALRRVRAIPGVGDAIARRIIGLRNDGTDEALERQRGRFPSGLLELLDIPRLKPSAVVKLNDLGIASLSEAEEAARHKIGRAHV